MKLILFSFCLIHFSFIKREGGGQGERGERGEGRGKGKGRRGRNRVYIKSNHIY